jgi:hypothetical protein
VYYVKHATTTNVMWMAVSSCQNMHGQPGSFDLLPCPGVSQVQQKKCNKMLHIRMMSDDGDQDTQSGQDCRVTDNHNNVINL